MKLSRLNHVCEGELVCGTHHNTPIGRNILRADIGLRSERRPFLIILVYFQPLQLTSHLHFIGASLSGLSRQSLAVGKHRPVEVIESLEAILDRLVWLLRVAHCG